MGATIEIVELWCGDCAADVLFELVPSEGTAREYACLTCGAAYIEPVAEPVRVDTEIRGVA